MYRVLRYERWWCCTLSDVCQGVKRHGVELDDPLDLPQATHIFSFLSSQLSFNRMPDDHINIDKREQKCKKLLFCIKI